MVAEAKNLDLPEGVSPDNVVVMSLKDGDVLIELYPEVAPKTVEQIKSLVKKGFYDGIVFHRVIDKFMAQTGDPTGTGTGGSGNPIPDEFNTIQHKRGIVSMANSGQKNSQDSQFFILFADSPWLDGSYTVFGKVIKNMIAVDKIKRGDEGANGMVKDPDKIIKMQMASDVITSK